MSDKFRDLQDPEDPDEVHDHDDALLVHLLPPVNTRPCKTASTHIFANVCTQAHYSLHKTQCSLLAFPLSVLCVGGGKATARESG